MLFVPLIRRRSGSQSLALFGALCLGLLSAAPVTQGAVRSAALKDLQVFPREVHLATQEDRQSVVVQAVYADGVTRDVTAEASIKMREPLVARYERGTILPATNGQTQAKVEFAGKSVVIPVTVAQAGEVRPISFKLDVMPVFMKAGCNSGGCHGASSGKDGFQLSLFGFDADGDHHRLTREILARRINLALPDESLLLDKALGRVPHGGGERFAQKSALHLTLLRWLEAGAPKDASNVATVTGIDLMPATAVLEGSNATQRLTVRASYSDGTTRDVTSLAVFISNNEPTAQVSDTGVITAGQRGEAFVMARFGTHTVGCQTIVVPAEEKFVFPEVAENNYVDKLVHAKLRKLRIVPSELCDDRTYARRVYLDVTGTLPTPAELETFLNDKDAKKRALLVDTLLARKEFADLWVMKFAELLQIRSNNDQFSYKSALLYYNWLHGQFQRNVPLDRIVQELLTASGSNFKEPAASFYQVERDTLKTAENVAQVFMGMRIQCAQCHNHPFDRWTMNDYYSFAAFFPQVGRKGGEDPREAIIFDRTDGEVKHPVTGKNMTPKFLGGESPNLGKGSRRREALAKWLASPDNPYFARNMANIVWAHFMGKGIIEPVDDVRISNPASNPELLDALGARFTEYNYDFKKLVRDICTSRTYQLSTRATPSNALDDRNFARGSIRRLRAEVLLDCISQVTETADKFQGLPKGARAVQIADGNVNTYFLTAFGRSTRASVCSCEVRTEPNLSQALHLLNGSTVNGKIQEGGLIKTLIKEAKEPEKIIEALYLRCLSRPPTAEEATKLQTFLGDGKAAEQVYSDVFWSLLNSKEFLFNH